MPLQIHERFRCGLGKGRGLTTQYTTVGFSNVFWFTDRNVIFMVLGHSVDNVIFRG